MPVTKTEKLVSKKIETEKDDLWYYPTNRWMFRHQKNKNPSPINIPIINTENNLKKVISIKPGKNVLTDEEYNFILENEDQKTLKPYFDEGSFVWDKNRKKTRITEESIKKSKPVTDIDAILKQVSEAATVEDLEKIATANKQKEVLEAIKNKYAEINAANASNNETEQNQDLNSTNLELN